MQNNLEKQFDEIIAEYKKSLDGSVEEVLTEIGNDMISQLQVASPVSSYDSSDGAHLRDCWAMKTKYHGVRYIGNTKLVHDNIPLINLIEFGAKGNPFVERTFEINKDSLYTKFIQKLGGKLK